MAPRHAEEIPIHSAFTSAVRPALRRPLACVLASITLFAAPLACADEFDWVYFPMYPNDTAHAVHLGSLKFRPDGLLSAATRYPRTGGEPWTEQESKAGWYNYDERLIDCETGFFLETATSLLARDGARLASRAKGPEQQVERLETHLRESAERRWPQQSDVFLACAAASSPTFKKQRAAQAAKVQPLFSDVSLIETLGADTAPLFALARMRYDFSRIAKRPAASASDLFHDMRGQYQAWRKATNGALGSAAVVAPGARGDDTVRAEANRQLDEAGALMLEITSIQGGIIEYRYPGATAFFGIDHALRLESARTDCEYGISVPVAIQKLRTDGKPGSRSQLRAKAVLHEIERRYTQTDAEGPFGGFSLDPDAANVCQLVADIRHPKPAAAADPKLGLDPDVRGALAYGIEPGALARHATPEAMLITIRAAQRRHAR